MKTINPNKFAIAAGLTSVVFYLGCTFTILIFGKDLIIRFSNLLMHGVDFTNIIRMDIPVWETVCGIFVSFIFWGILAYLLALIYNRMK